MIVDAGKKRVAELFTGLQSNSSTKFIYIRVGNGGDNTSSSQTTLDNQVGATKTATPTLVGNSLVYTVTYTGADISSNTI